MATDGRWKLSRYHNGVVCLHDVITDPQEQYDRFQEKPEIRGRSPTHAPRMAIENGS